MNSNGLNNIFQIGYLTVYITILVIIFVISPISKIIYLALFIKLLILTFLIYTIYLSINQITYMNLLSANNNFMIGDVFVNQLGLYIFIFLLGLCFIYIVRTII